MRQTTLTIILVIALAGTGYFIYRFFSSGPATDNSSEAVATPGSPALAEYRKIEALHPDLAIFNDSSFRALFSPLERAGVATVTAPTHTGRANPFVAF